MREILIRGKRLDNKGWMKIDFVNEYIKYFCYRDTVGQYTGLNDMTGKKIFEGDIVRWESEGEKHDLVVAFRNGSFVCLHPELDIEPEPETLYECLGLGLTVVGDIYRD